jgi:hypothetical protein
MLVRNMIIKSAINGDVLAVLNKVSLIYFAAEFMIRIFFQKRVAINIKSYLSNGIKKNTIAYFIALQSIINIYDLLSLLFVLLSAFFIVCAHYNLKTTIVYILSNFLIVLIINILVLTCKWLKEGNRIQLIVNICLSLLFLLSVKHFKKMMFISTAIFSYLNTNALYLILTSVLFGLVFFSFIQLIKKRLYIE